MLSAVQSRMVTGSGLPQRMPPAAGGILLQEAGFDALSARKHPWLLPFLQGYEQLGLILASCIERTGRIPACGKGCSHCCTQRIPVTPPEVMLIALWLRRQEKDIVSRPGHCRFLDERGACGVYPVRPVACRRYTVFGEPCAPGEMPTESRPHDVLWPSRRSLLHILQSSSLFYVRQGLLERNTLPELEFFARHTCFLHEVDWAKLLGSGIQ